jgi:methanogenic corrinoid protein MtbC1
VLPSSSALDPEQVRVTTDAPGVLTIGALAAATGIPVETLRTWERRYGFPVAQRKPSGHRVYHLDTIPRLRLISRALAGGHRAAEVLTASESGLEALLAALPSPGAPSAESGGARVAPAASPTDPAALFAAIRAFDGERLRRMFQGEWARLGPLAFLERCAGPMLAAIGEAWSTGAIDVRHEHFASAALGDFLRTVRIPIEERADGPLVALTTLPGELHGLGLQMLAVVIAVAGWRPVVLGVDTPIDQVAALAREVPLAAVAVSCAPPRRKETAVALSTLRQRLPNSVVLLVGGAGAPVRPRQPGLVALPDLRAFDRWLRERRR